MEPATLPRLLMRNATERGGLPALRHKRLGLWRTWSWTEQAEEVRRLAYGLAALGFGAGERLAVLAYNRAETYWAFCAAQALRGVPVPLPADIDGEDLAARLRVFPASVAIAEGQEQVDKLLAVRHALPELRAIVHVDGRGLRGYPAHGLLPLTDVLADGERLRQVAPGLVDGQIAAARDDEIAVVLHTSGGGGVARGVPLSHRELVASADSAIALFGLSASDRVMGALSTSWFLDHQTSYVQSYRAGYCVHCPEARETVVPDLRDVAPTYLAMPPRALEALLRTVDARMSAASRWRRRLVARAWGSRSGLTRAFVVAPLVDRLGLSSLRVAVAVGRRVDRRLAERWRGLGLPLVGALGCTEVAGLLATLDDDGGLARTAPGFDVRVAEGSGDVAFRRGRVDGGAGEEWRDSGDVALPLGGGRSMPCRRDELFSAATGDTIAPSVAEARLTAGAEVREAVVLPDGRGGAAALVVPDPDLLAAWAAERRIPYSTPSDLARNEELVAHFARIVSAVNVDLGRERAGAAPIAAFSLSFAPLDVDEFGPSGQPRRRLLEARRADILTALRSGSRDGWVEPTPATIAAPMVVPPLRESAA